MQLRTPKIIDSTFGGFNMKTTKPQTAGEFTFDKYNEKWQHPQAKWGKRWEKGLSILGLVAFVFLAIGFFVSKAGLL